MNKAEFFTNEEHKSTISSFKSKINPLQLDTDFEKKRNECITVILTSMLKSPSLWDKNCQINIEWIGDQFISTISNNKERTSKKTLDDIHTMLFRFLFELYLSVKEDLSPEFLHVIDFTKENIDSFHPSTKNQIYFSLHGMPISIIKELLRSNSIDNIKKFNEVAERSNEATEKWEENLRSREERVIELKKSLDSYENAFNFVGLYQGFDDLSADKRKEKNILLYSMIFIGIIILLPITLEASYIYTKMTRIEEIRNGLFAAIIPTASIIFILIYYFRVLLFNYKSVKSQLLQIDLRKTLCRFIQHYSTYSKTIKDNDKDSLHKFENIIFSGIVTNDGSLPSTYDGLDQLSKIAKAIRS